MINLAALLNTWQQWSAYNVMTRAVGHAPDQDSSPGALDALRDSHELVDLLTSWQWQAMYAARRDGAGWEEIAVATQTTEDAASAGYLVVVDRLERVLGRDVREYREVL